MAQAIVCPACGAKIKEGRPACLRCGEKLPATESATPAAVPTGFSKFVADQRGPLLAAGIILGLLLLGVAVARTPSASEPSPAATQSASSAKRPEARPASAERRSVDHGA